MKRTYHTNIMMIAKADMLSKENKKNIPKSTRHSWKKRDCSNIFGREYAIFDENIEFLSNQTLLNATKGLYFIYCTWVSMTDNIREMKTQLRKNRETIVRTIEKVEPLMGLKRACKFLKNSMYGKKE